MRPARKVAITVYVPAGNLCEGYTFQCPFLQQSYNIPAYFCVLIPESFWWMQQPVYKHKLCPSWYSKTNTLSNQDIINHRLRAVKKAIKDGRPDILDKLIHPENNGDDDDEN